MKAESAITLRMVALRAETLDEENRTVDAVLATSQRVLALDPTNWETVEEILLMAGAKLPDQVILLDGHSSTIKRAQGEYSSVDEIRGSVRNLRIQGDKLLGTIHFAEDEPSNRAWEKVRQGHLRDVSVGTRYLKTTVVQPHTTAAIANRQFKAGERPLFVRTAWRPIEASVVPIGADPGAKIREATTLQESSMNDLLLTYLHHVGLRADADDEEARAYLHALKGRQGVIAGVLDVLDRDCNDDDAIRVRAEILRGLGVNPEDPTKPYKAPAPGDQPGGGNDNAGQSDDGLRSGDDGEALRVEGQRRERERQTSIRQLAAADVPAEVLTRAIDEGWDVNRSSQEFLRSIRDARQPAVGSDGVPAAHIRSHQSDCNRNSLGLALVIRAGLDPVASYVEFVDGVYRPRHEGQSTRNIEQWADRADRYQDWSLVDICREACRLDGIALPSNRHELIRAAMSGSALSDIFTTNVNARVLSGYNDSTDTTDGWVAFEDLPDFRSNERATMGKFGSLQKLARGKEAEHLDTSDSKESYKAARYAGQFVVDEQDIIDDRFGAITQFSPEDMGNSARQLRPDLVYAILLANAALDADSVALFHAATHANYATSGSALAAGTLQTGLAAMSKQRIGGRPLNVRGRFLIVPQDLQFTADILLSSPQRIIASASGGTYNPLQSRGITLVSDDRIGAVGCTDPVTGTAYTGSATNWFLAARPGEQGAKTIIVGYVRGTGRGPQIRSFNLTKGQWGIGWDIKMDIGAKALDYRSLYMATGAS